MEKKLLMIVNPRSGKTKSRAPLFDAVSRFGRSGWLVRVAETDRRGHAAELAAQLGGGYDAVVCVGGDGTLNETITGLMTLSRRPPLGYLPFGSTNDFAASLHIPASPPEAAELVADGTPRALDIGCHNGRYFAYVASFGAFTRSSYSAPQSTKNALGHFAYLLEGLKDLDSLRPYRCRVETGGEVFDGDFIFGGVCNSTSLGGLVKLDPERVKMDDGKFELLLLRMPKTPLDLQNLILALTKMQYDYPGVIFRHVDSVTVTTDDDVPWSLDGEYAPSAPQVDIRLLSGAVELLLSQ
ncbi:MAG: diacylglycerol kinase family lipid kinase [Ruminococcaceae bacterium]|nr:diacylglycerol kinase family lipid kinase [Oscillospiraceae bacterium]